jgi:hypothetical protein
LTSRATKAESILRDVVGLVLIEIPPEEFVVGGVDIDTFPHVRDLSVFVAIGNLAVKGLRPGLPVGNIPISIDGNNIGTYNAVAAGVSA